MKKTTTIHFRLNETMPVVVESIQTKLPVDNYYFMKIVNLTNEMCDGNISIFFPEYETVAVFHIIEVDEKTGFAKCDGRAGTKIFEDDEIKFKGFPKGAMFHKDVELYKSFEE